MALVALPPRFVELEAKATVLKMPLKSAEPVEARWLSGAGCSVCIITLDFYYAD